MPYFSRGLIVRVIQQNLGDLPRVDRVEIRDQISSELDHGGPTNWKFVSPACRRQTLSVTPAEYYDFAC
jgi:hypothetical protein